MRTIKQLLLLLLLFFYSDISYGLNIRIIESQSFNGGHAMDTKWASTATAMGHNPTISPQTTLDNNTFFLTTDILIISSGVINLPANRINTILQFIQTGKPVYLQSEYLSSYTTNQGFASIVSSLGGSFSWSAPFSGTLAPMNVLGTFATTNEIVSSLSYYWYSVSGVGDCRTVNFLEFGGAYHGFQYIPSNNSFGSIITTTDQDWVNSSTSIPLMKNIITHLISPDQLSNLSSVNLGNDTTLCQGQSVTLNGGSATSYLWSNGSTAPSINVSTSGTYWLQINGGQCPSSDTISITINPTPIVNLGNDTTICQGQTVTLNGGSATSYLWSNGSTASSINSSTSGIYWLQASNGQCSATDSITISINLNPTFNLGNDTTICQGQSVTLNGGSATSYLWSNGSTAPSINVSTSGIYWLQLSNGQCPSTDSITITINPNSIVNLGNDTTICQGQTVTLNGGSATSYLWSNGSTAPSINVSTSGIYWLQASNGQCSATDSITITINLNPTFNLGNDTTICQGQSVTLNGGSATSYLWSNGSTAPSINVSTSGIYWLQLSNGQCPSTDSITITINPNPIVNLGNDTTICQGQTVTLNGGSATSYLWSNGSTSTSINASTSGIYWLQASNGQCSATDSITITINPNPIVSLGNDTTICQGTAITLAGTGALTYTWDHGISNGVAFIQSAGTTVYTVTGTDLNGCIDTAQISVNVHALPDVFAVGDTVCNGETVTLNVQNAVTYTWSQGVTNGVAFTPSLGSTNYTVTGTDAIGCENTYTVNVMVNPLPNISAGLDDSISSGATVILTGSGAGIGGAYSWDNDVVDGVSFSPSDSAVYTVIGTDINGCTGTDQVIISIIPTPVKDELIYYVPNAFTPDNNNSNEVFKPIFTSGFDPQGYTLYIFDRWGETIFESHNTNVGWDGKFNNQAVQDGVYIWKIIFTYKDSADKEVLIGNVSLLR